MQPLGAAARRPLVAKGLDMHERIAVPIRGSETADTRPQAT